MLDLTCDKLRPGWVWCGSLHFPGLATDGMAGGCMTPAIMLDQSHTDLYRTDWANGISVQ